MYTGTVVKDCSVLSWYAKNISFKRLIEITSEKKQHFSFIVLYSPENPKISVV
jgi:hypothetical protein